MMSTSYKGSILAGREGKKKKLSIPGGGGGGLEYSSAVPLSSASSSSSLLGQVWPKLRVFQREAFEFATQGKRYDRQWSSAAADDLSSSSSSPSSPLPGAKIIQNPYAMGGSDYLDPSLVGQGRILLADEMGLGKTVTSLAIMAHYEKEWPLLILCPASLRYTWPAEIEKFFPSIPAQSIYVVAGFQDVGFTTRKDVKVVICTYSLLQQRSAVAQVLAESAQASSTSKSSQPLFNCIIADESHNLKSKTSQRTALILPLLQRARRLLLLSGTPALAAPVELWTQLHVLAPNLFGSFASYTKSYCNPQRKQIGRNRFITEYKGSSNEAELHAKIRQIMVRRLKSNVLQELPAKQRSIIPAIMASGKEREKARLAMLDVNGGGGSALSNLEKLLEQELGVHHGQQQQQQQGRSNTDFERRSKVMRAYQTTGIGKAKAVVDYLLDWLAGSTGKILVFAHHKQVMDTIEEALFKTTTSLSNSSNHSNSRKGGQQQHIRIDGAVPTSVRANLVRKFQTSPSVRVGLLSMTAAGVGLTLTAASSK
jgi:SWI/SNF-related matrix-associated actin-dependent regulator of chromatin subfamily A-like protein 1